MSNGTLFNIPLVNLPRLEADIDRLIKRANKIGVPAPTMALGAKTVENDERGIAIEYIEVVVAGESPKYDGWQFVAAIDLDRENPDAPNVVNVLPGFEKDPAWSTMEERCDHCNVGRRNRKKLVVVQHDNGEQKIVGSTCLHDFLGGKSPKAIAAWAEILSGLFDTDYSEIDPNAPRSEMRVDPETYLAWVIRSIASEGWIAKGRATEDQTPTAVAALDAMVGFSQRHGALHDGPMPSSFEEAAAVLAWGREIELTGRDYMDNLAAVAQKSGWRYRDLGLGASMVIAFRRDKPQAADVVAVANAAHVGTVGERIRLMDLRVVTADEKPSKFGSGTVTIVKMVDADGSNLTWWADEKAPAVGDVICGSATIKKHSEFRGVPETTIGDFSWIEFPA